MPEYVQIFENCIKEDNFITCEFLLKNGFNYNFNDSSILKSLIATKSCSGLFIEFLLSNNYDFNIKFDVEVNKFLRSTSTERMEIFFASLRRKDGFYFSNYALDKLQTDSNTYPLRTKYKNFMFDELKLENYEICDYLIKNRIYFNIISDTHNEIFINALTHNYTKICDYLINKINIDLKNKNINACFEKLLKNENSEQYITQCAYVLEKGGGTTLTQNQLTKIFYIFIKINDIKTIKILLPKIQNLRINYRNIRNDDEFLTNCFTTIVPYLFNCTQRQLLLWGAKTSHLETLNNLYNKNVNLNNILSDGFTILYYACQNNNNDVIKFLLNIGIDINIKFDYNGKITTVVELFPDKFQNIITSTKKLKLSIK